MYKVVFNKYNLLFINFSWKSSDQNELDSMNSKSGMSWVVILLKQRCQQNMTLGILKLQCWLGIFYQDLWDTILHHYFSKTVFDDMENIFEIVFRLEWIARDYSWPNWSQLYNIFLSFVCKLFFLHPDQGILIFPRGLENPKCNVVDLIKNVYIIYMY